jgi:CheY-like chemotaxis protein
LPGRAAENALKSRKPDAASGGEGAMTATQILVVEDEFLIALDIVGALEQAGITVVGPAGTVNDALEAIEREPLHGALLDAHLGGESVSQVADALAARGIPFAFVSGYGREQLPPAYREVPLVKKPFMSSDLLAAVAKF